MTPRQFHRQGVEERDGRRCRFAELGGCRGRTQADHILKIQALRRWQGQLQRRAINGEQLTPGQLHFTKMPLKLLIADPRNGWMLCVDGHHVPKDRGEIPTELLIDRWPVAFFGFIDDFDLGVLIHIEFGADAAPIIREHGRRAGNAFTGWID